MVPSQQFVSEQYTQFTTKLLLCSVLQICLHTNCPLIYQRETIQHISSSPKSAVSVLSVLTKLNTVGKVSLCFSEMENTGSDCRRANILGSYSLYCVLLVSLHCLSFQKTGFSLNPLQSRLNKMGIWQNHRIIVIESLRL